MSAVKWITPAEAAVKLGYLHVAAVYRAVRQGNLTARRVRKTINVGLKQFRERENLLEIDSNSVCSFAARPRRKAPGGSRPYVHRTDCRCRVCEPIEKLATSTLVRLTRDLGEDLARAAATQRIPKAEVVRQALTEYLDVRGMLSDDLT